MTDVYRTYDPESRILTDDPAFATGGTNSDSDALTIHITIVSTAPDGTQTPDPEYLEGKSAYIVFHSRDTQGNCYQFTQNTVPALEVDGADLSITVPTSVIRHINGNYLRYILWFNEPDKIPYSRSDSYRWLDHLYVYDTSGYDTPSETTLAIEELEGKFGPDGKLDPAYLPDAGIPEYVGTTDSKDKLLPDGVELTDGTVVPAQIGDWAIVDDPAHYQDDGTYFLQEGGIWIRTKIAEWGQITGDLEDQTDLKNALDSLSSDISDETSRAMGAESGLQGEMDLIDGRVTAIEGKIPAEASVSNKLADKQYVDNADAAIAGDLSTEIAARQGADAALQSNIDTLSRQTQDSLATKRDKIVGTHSKIQAYIQYGSSEDATNLAEGVMDIVAEATTGGTLARRTAEGRIKATDPNASNDVSTKNYTDTQDALKVDKTSIVSQFQTTPDNTHIPSEKLTKDYLDNKVDKLSSSPAGTYPKVTVNAQGQVTSGTTLSSSDIPNLDWSKITTGKPTTLAGYGITDGVQSNTAITGATHTKITYDSKGLVTSGTDLAESDIPPLSISKTSGLQTALDGKAPTNHASSNTTYGIGTSGNYGHVKFDNSIGTTDRTDVAISEKGIREFVNSSIATATANFLGTYDAVSQLNIPQATVDTYTFNPTPAVQTQVANAIASELSLTPTSNDFIFVSVNQQATIGTDWYWRFKYNGTQGWMFEYPLNNSTYTQAQWDTINSGMTSADKTKLDGIQAGAEVNVQADWSQTTTTADDYIKNKPTLSAVATSGSYNDLINKPTIPIIPDISVTVPSSGNALTDVSVDSTDKHKLIFTTGTFLTSHQDISGKADTNLRNLSGIGGTLAGGKTIVWDAVNQQWTYGEAGAVDDVKVNGTSVVSSKVANVTVPTKVSDLTNDSGYATTFSELSSHPTTLSGYGISDAYIQSGVIKLGNDTITPIASLATGVGLAGGPITSSGTIKASLKSETASSLASASMGSTANRQYAVGVDKDGYLSVNVPWQDNFVGQYQVSNDVNRPLALVNSTVESPVDFASSVNFSTNAYLNPSKGEITANRFTGLHSGKKTALTSYTDSTLCTLFTIAQADYQANGYNAYIKFRFKSGTSATSQESGEVDVVFTRNSATIRYWTGESSLTSLPISSLYVYYPISTSSLATKNCYIAMKSSAYSIPFEIEVLEADIDYTLATTLAPFTDTTSMAYQNVTISNGTDYSGGWTGYMQGNISGQSNIANYSYYSLGLQENYALSGERLIRYSLCALSSDGKSYKVNNGTSKFTLPIDMFIPYIDRNANQTVEKFKYRGQLSYPISYLTNASYQGRAFTIPTLTSADYNKTLYIRGSIDSDGLFVPDGNITVTMSAGYTFIPFGRVIATSTGDAPTSFALDCLNSDAYTLDSGGKLTHINGKQIDGAVQLTDVSANFVLQSTPDYAEFPYRATINRAGVTSSTYVQVTFSNSQAESMIYSPVAVSGTDVIYLYARQNVGTQVIPTISIGMDTSDMTVDNVPTSGSTNPVSSGGVYDALPHGNIGSDTKPVKIVNGQAVAVTNDLLDGWKTYNPSSWSDYSAFIESHSVTITRIQQYSWPSVAYCNITMMFKSGWGSETPSGVYRAAGGSSPILLPIYFAGTDLHLVDSSHNEITYSLSSTVDIQYVSVYYLE